MLATTRPKNRDLFRFDGRAACHLVRVIIDVAMMSFGHEHHRPVDWLVRS
jgi:hypothetical protein